MRWKTFLQIILLLLIAGAIFYAAFPKYYFYSIKPPMVFRGNKITGKIMYYTKGTWETLQDKTVKRLNLKGALGIFNDKNQKNRLVIDGLFDQSTKSKGD